MTIDMSSPEINLPSIAKAITEKTAYKINNHDNLDEQRQMFENQTEIPSYKRDVIEARRQGGIQAKEQVLESVGIFRESLLSDKNRYSFLKQKENCTQDDLQEIERLKENIENNQNAINSVRASSETFYKLLNQTLDETSKDALNNYVDEKTGLYLFNVLIENSGNRVKEWIQDQNFSARQQKLIMTDMMLFHTANEKIGPTGLDDRLFICMQGEIAISRYLGDEKSLYGNMPNPDDNKYIQLFFPKHSKSREKLDYLKENGINIYPFRVNAGGGDEFGYTIETDNDFDSDKNAEIEKTVSETISHVVESISITPDIEVIDHKAKIRELSFDEISSRKEQYQLFCNSINNLKFKHRPERDEHITPEQDEMNHFIDSLRIYFQKEGEYSSGKLPFEKEILSPSHNLTMEFATIEFEGNTPTMEDAILLFLFGKDSYKNQRESNKFGFYNDKNELNHKKLDEYTTNLAARIKNTLSRSELKDSEVVKQAIMDNVVNDATKNFYNLLNEEVNREGKHHKKRDVLLRAIAGDAKAMITIGASEQSGRSLYIPKNNQEKTEVNKRIFEFYQTIFDEEKQKAPENRDKGIEMLKQVWESKKNKL